MAIEKQESYKTYTVSGSDLKAFLLTEVEEIIHTVELTDRIKVITSKGVNPAIYSHYFITLNEAKAALGVGELEEFYSVNFSADVLTIITLQKLK